uniref:Uncharacterized protein n=1 Tax=Zea mays TaxID=4577 RepID=B4FVZ8_MAIZE|nr:unknown [Zea mays]
MLVTVIRFRVLVFPGSKSLAFCMRLLYTISPLSFSPISAVVLHSCYCCKLELICCFVSWHCRVAYVSMQC